MAISLHNCERVHAGGTGMTPDGFDHLAFALLRLVLPDNHEVTVRPLGGAPIK
jgi:hypothetical protein